MNKLSCGLGVMALSLLCACNQGPKAADKTAGLAPHPLAGQPAAPNPAAPKPPTPAADPAPPAAAPAMAAAAPPAAPQADSRATAFEQQALADVMHQAQAAPRPARDFDYESFGGKSSKLSKNFGQPLVVNFWAVWCGYCVQEMPDIQEIYTANQGKFKLLGVCEDNRLDPPGFVKDHAYTWDFVYDKDNSGSKAYQIQGIPRTLFINRQGQVVVDFEGAMPRKAFEAAVAKII